MGDGYPDHFVGMFSEPSDGQVIDCIMPDGHIKPMVIFMSKTLFITYHFLAVHLN